MNKPSGISPSAQAWAPLFDQLRVDSPSDIQQAVLLDGVISESEIAELEGLTEDCLSAGGYSVQWQPNGGSSVTAPIGSDTETDRSFIAGCEKPNVGAIRDFAINMKRNPENLDEDAIIAECLVEKGVMGRGFSAEDMSRLGDSDSQMPWDESDPLVAGCFADPLDLLGK